MATEDFTTYDTTADPESRVTDTASKLDVDGLTSNEDCWWGDDKGASHFGAAFEHDLDIKYVSQQFSNEIGCWAVSNVVEDAKYWEDNLSQAIFVKRQGASDDLYVRECENAAQDQTATALTDNTKYYPSIERYTDVDPGDMLKVVIYTDEAQENEQETIAVSVPTGRNYRYNYGLVSYNNGEAHIGDVDIENLDLNEAVTAFIPRVMVY